jgi:hypothetical protein
MGPPERNHALEEPENIQIRLELTPVLVSDRVMLIDLRKAIRREVDVLDRSNLSPV